jgi:hypothetical protein
MEVVWFCKKQVPPTRLHDVTSKITKINLISRNCNCLAHPNCLPIFSLVVTQESVLIVGHISQVLAPWRMGCCRRFGGIYYLHLQGPSGRMKMWRLIGDYWLGPSGSCLSPPPPWQGRSHIPIYDILRTKHLFLQASATARCCSVQKPRNRINTISESPWKIIISYCLISMSQWDKNYFTCVGALACEMPGSLLWRSAIIFTQN